MVDASAYSSIGAIEAIGTGPPQNGGLQILHIWSNFVQFGKHLDISFQILHFIGAPQTFVYKSACVCKILASIFSFQCFVICMESQSRLFYSLEKSQLVLGASRVPMAQGLPKAGEGPGWIGPLGPGMSFSKKSHIFF